MTTSWREWRGKAAGAAAGALNAVQPWDRWRPRTVGTLILAGFRADLRGRNLFDSGRGARGLLTAKTLPPAADTGYRTLDGTHNDLTPGNALMGSVGSRFGRNRSLELNRTEEMPRLMSPAPAEVSEKLMKRHEFKPADTLNLLAGAWIQFQVHDWFDHGPNDRSDPTLLDWPAGSARHGQCPMRVDRTRRDPEASRNPDEPAMFVAAGTHWWDASQLYGVDAADAQSRRTPGGNMSIDPPITRDLRSSAGNSWIGLELMERLFRMEHNAIAAALRDTYPDKDEEYIHQKARLVNAALMAKIHTLDWTTAMLSNKTSVLGLRRIWWGLAGHRTGHRLLRWTHHATLAGIPGSRRALHGVDYSVTEEFVAVYRMHPLLPDTIDIKSLNGSRPTDTKQLKDLVIPHIEEVIDAYPLMDLVYSLGSGRAGRMALNNFPETLRDFSPPADPDLHIDLAAVDIFRVRERGVPRYNDFRRMMHLKPIASIDELGEDDATRTAIRELYSDVEDIDLLVGLFGEKCLDGFAFSETAFRVFLLMAERRLEADRFFTSDYNEKTYTEVGFEWVQSQDMRSVLLRHFPDLKDALAGVANPFMPWAGG